MTDFDLIVSFVIGKDDSHISQSAARDEKSRGRRCVGEDRCAGVVKSQCNEECERFLAGEIEDGVCTCEGGGEVGFWLCVWRLHCLWWVLWFAVREMVK
jgi:hypothetical protein